MAFRKEEREFQLELVNLQIYHEQFMSLVTVLLAIQFSILISATFYIASKGLNIAILFLIIGSIIMIAFTTILYEIWTKRGQKQISKLRQKYIEYL